jgi:23S rRNA pseudouridine1911/1915/1917 synthase
MTVQVGGEVTALGAVPAEYAGARLDAFVRHCLPHLSRRAIGQAFVDKLFLLDGRFGKKGDRLTVGSQLSFAGPPEWLAAQPLPTQALEIPVVYEDASILVLDKPAGVATHGFSARDGRTVANFVATRWPQLLEVGESRWEPGLLHRLDVGTSGLVLVAKTQAAFDALRAQFRRRGIGKIYWALVWGNADAEGVIDLSLAHDKADKRKMRSVAGTANGKQQRIWHALTKYRRIGAARGLTLLEIDMATGVTHQIRVHLASRGLPIVGDELYGGAVRQRFGLERHFLHAKKLLLRHPDDGRAMELVARLPVELQQVLEELGLAT